MNIVVGALLRSPLHGLLSANTLIISFTGRVSGRTFSTPISYALQGDALLCLTGCCWWKNLRGDPGVRMMLRGRIYPGRAEVIPPGSEETRAAIAALEP